MTDIFEYMRKAAFIISAFMTAISIHYHDYRYIEFYILTGIYWCWSVGRNKQKL